MPKKVIIFIDGQNVYHSLKAMSVKEIDIDYGKIFADMLDSDDELIRTYLFRPEKVQSFHIDRNRIAKMLLQQEGKNEIDDAELFALDYRTHPEPLKSKIESEFDQAVSWMKEIKQNFSQTDYKYTQIARTYDDFQIIKSGVLKIDPYKKEIIGEKGVDVSLSVKMVEMSLTDKLDKIILFSGDYDHSEAVSLCQDKLKKVHIVKIMKGVPPSNISSSNDLLSKADKVFNLYEADLKRKYKRERI